MKNTFLLVLVFLFRLSASAQETPALYSEYGELLFTQLLSAPFPHPKRAEGHSYSKQFFPADKYYNDSSVAIFIPKGYRKTDKVDLVVHLHGWWNNIDTTLKRYQLPQQVAESGKAAENTV